MYRHAKFRIKEYNNWNIEIEYTKCNIFWLRYWYEEYPYRRANSEWDPGYYNIAYEWSLKSIFEENGHTANKFGEAFAIVNEYCEWTERYEYLKILINELEKWYNNKVDKALEEQRKYEFDKSTKQYIY